MITYISLINWTEQGIKSVKDTVKRADAGECSACHTVEGFKPAKFGLVEHKATAYPLEGKHAAVACAKCHLPAGKATLYRIKFALCSDCHCFCHICVRQSALRHR